MLDILVWLFSQLAVVLAEGVVDSVSNDLKSVDAVLVVDVADLSLLTYVCSDPERFKSLLTVVVDILAAQFEAGADEVWGLYRALGELWLVPEDVAHYLNLLLLDGVVGGVDLNVSLKWFLHDNLVLAVFHSDDNLKRKLFQRRNIISEVTRVLKDGNPNAHGMLLYEAVQLVNVKAIVDVPLQSHNILYSSLVLPVRYLVIQPAILFQDFKSLLASEELGNEDVHVAWLTHVAWGFLF